MLALQRLQRIQQMGRSEGGLGAMWSGLVLLVRGAGWLEDDEASSSTTARAQYIVAHAQQVRRAVDDAVARQFGQAEEAALEVRLGDAEEVHLLLMGEGFSDLDDLFDEAESVLGVEVQSVYYDESDDDSEITKDRMVKKLIDGDRIRFSVKDTGRCRVCARRICACAGSVQPQPWVCSYS